MQNNENNEIVIIRGGGDLATGVVQKFYRTGFRVLILETAAPTAIRRSVALCEAVYDGPVTVEDISCRKIGIISEAEVCWKEGVVPLLIDPEGKSICEIKPEAVIDAIIAKRNLGTTIDMAEVTIALGPGFNAGVDVNAVIETKRGHDLGRIILNGYAEPDTGIPGEIAGESTRRVIHAPADGVIRHIKNIGDIVDQGEPLFMVDNIKSGGAGAKSIKVQAQMNGLLRGLIRDGIQVHKGMKIADIDPRTDINWRTISDKARCLGGAALEAYLFLREKGEGRREKGEGC